METKIYLVVIELYKRDGNGNNVLKNKRVKDCFFDKEKAIAYAEKYLKNLGSSELDYESQNNLVETDGEVWVAYQGDKMTEATGIVYEKVVK